MGNTLQNLLVSPEFQKKVKCELRVYKPNDQIIKQGEIHENVYCVKAGKVKVIAVRNIEGKVPIRSNIVNLGPGDVFGEFGLFDDSPANADVVVIEDAELFEIDIQSFREYLDVNLEIKCDILLDMFKTLVKRLQHADKAILNLFAWEMWHTS